MARFVYNNAKNAINDHRPFMTLWSQDLGSNLACNLAYDLAHDLAFDLACDLTCDLPNLIFLEVNKSSLHNY